MCLAYVVKNNSHLLLELGPFPLETPQKDLVMEVLAHPRLLHFHHIDSAVHEMIDYVLLIAWVWSLGREHILYQLNRVLLELFINLRIYHVKRGHL